MVIYNKKKERKKDNKREENKYVILKEGRNFQFAYAYNQTDQSHSSRDGLYNQKKWLKTSIYTSKQPKQESN